MSNKIKLLKMRINNLLEDNIENLNTQEIIELSQKLDAYIVEEQRKRVIKIKNQ